MSEPLVIDEPVATGWLRTELHGDRDKAAGYVQEARALLGGMRTMYGVNERIAAGEGGGFYQQRKILSDGTLIEVTTNGGADTVRIYPAPTPKPAPEPEPKPKPPEMITHLPYLWVGVRIVSGGLWATDNWHRSQEFVEPDRTYTEVPHVCMWQPPDHDGGERKILSNRESFIPTFDMGVAPVGDYTVFASAYSHDDYPLYYQDHFIPAMMPQHVLTNNFHFYTVDTRVVYTDKKLCLVPRYNALGLPMLAPDYSLGDPEVTWDYIFVSDDHNAMGILGESGATVGDSYDPHIIGPVSADYFANLKTKTTGEYFFKVALQGRECKRFLNKPVEIEIMCIVGRGLTRIKKTHRITLTEATDYFSGLMPRGFYQIGPPSVFTPSVRDAGPNRHGPHWWQGMLSIFVPPAQVEVPVDQAIAPSIRFSPDGEVGLPPGNDFEPGPYFPPLARCPGGQYYD